ncbi:MAG TPA: hypothetical protein VFF23_03190 [Hanamia sp.]|nr:hypothetical protein [Hanamia sp.]
MKKFILIALVLFSCQSKTVKEKKDLEKNLFNYFTTRFQDIESTIHLDSVRIVKFDTITANTILYRKMMSIYDVIEENQNRIRKILSDMKDSKQMMRLTAGLSSALYNNSLDDFKEKQTEFTSLQEKDSVLIKNADSLSEKLKTTDSTTLVYLQVQCLLQYQRKDLSVGRDTGYAFLNTNHDIVRREDIFK